MTCADGVRIVPFPDPCTATLPPTVALIFKVVKRSAGARERSASARNGERRASPKPFALIAESDIPPERPVVPAAHRQCEKSLTELVVIGVVATIPDAW